MVKKLINAKSHVGKTAAFSGVSPDDSIVQEIKPASNYFVRWVVKKAVKKDKSTKSSDKGATGIVKRRLRTSDGKIFVYRVVDANSTSFSSNFDNVFRNNVRKARRANRLLAGVGNRGTSES